ncbi:hypothetical protein HO173_002435 [Letharia columbiana]|uniref:Fido domain-containing protein n=1 Tax=Letharia columbiana TaxID=112416 RepID=A0A8H6G2C3_9LECA|nr:uncharacterized protein HO173_002435 [Letharia columbiana]KAF6239174.1 hypothetical protein HO173_002435 [Letharia columbiana]
MENISPRRSPERSPVRRSRGHSRPPIPTFSNLSINTNQAGESSSSQYALRSPTSPDSPLGREGQETYRDTLRRTFRRRWANWGNSEAGEQKFNFTIRMSDTRLFYSRKSRPQEQFNEALQYLNEIQGIRRDSPEKTAEIMSQCIQDDMKLVIFGSNMIERAGLNLAETIKMVDRIFKGQEVDVGERDDDYQMQLENYIEAKHSAQEAENHILRTRWEVIQHARALWFLTNSFVIEQRPLSEELIKETHKILCTNVSHPKYDTPWQDYAGKYRNHVRQPGSKQMGAEVNAGGTHFTASQMVPKAMSRFVTELNNKIEEATQRGALDPFCLAAWACADFVVIHPFLDGNGRTCRILLNAITMRYAGIVVPIGEHDEERSKYLNIKRRYSEDCDGEGEFAEMVLDRGTARLQAMRDKVKGSMRLR